MNGWGPKSSVCPSKPGKSNFFWRDIPGFCWDISAVPAKFEKTKFVFNFWPLNLFCVKQSASACNSLLQSSRREGSLA